MARYPTRFQLRTLWNAATGVSILVLGALLVGLVWLMGQIFGFLQPVLVPLAVAAIIAYALGFIVVVQAVELVILQPWERRAARWRR